MDRIDRLKTVVEGKIAKSLPFYLDRARWVTESYRQTEGQPTILRRARAGAHALANIRIAIQPDELIVGTQAVYENYEFPEFGPLPTDVPEDAPDWAAQQDLLEDLRAYWAGEDIRSVNLSRRSPEIQRAVDEGLFHPHTAITSHLTANFPVGIERGVYSLLEEIRERRREAEDPEQRTFYRAAEIACEGLLVFARRYADLADHFAASEEEPARAAELREIARICRKVPGQAAETLHEAIQSQWLIHTAIQLESVGGGYGMGSVDRTFYPFFCDDIASGRLTSEEVQELIDCFWLKLIERNALAFVSGDAVMLCGYDVEGNEVANELSRICLKSSRKLYWPSPALYVRVTPDIPDDIRRTCVEMLQEGRGYPVLLNEPLIRECFARVARRPGDECRIGALGCAELSIAGAWRGWVDNPWFNLAKCLERSLAARNGSGLRGALEFEEIVRGFEGEVRRGLRLGAACEDIMDRVCGERVPAPLISVFMDDCLERGDDVTREGARYRSTTMGAVGVPNVADSLAAIRKLVFEEGSVPADELAEALDRDYADAEALRQRLLHESPKYGNGDTYVDAMARRVAEFFCDEVGALRNCHGEPFTSMLFGYTSHVRLGRLTDATPDGRHAGEPLAHSVGPMQGRDREGPTAMLRSVASLDHRKPFIGSMFVIELLPDSLPGPEGGEKLWTLIRTAFDLGLPQCHVNCVDHGTLRAAQRDPERFGHLLVRVSGFSARFVDLSEDIQDHIIARTPHAGDGDGETR